jgi:hypothetical protein
MEQKDMEKLVEKIRSRANYSLAILGMSFVRHGSPRFVNLKGDKDGKRNAKRVGS